MTHEEEKFKKEELQKVVELALSIQNKKIGAAGDTYSKKVLTSTAQELGIDEQVLEEAIREHRRQRAQQRKFQRRVGLGVGSVLLIAAIVAYIVWPHPFTGNLKLTMTSGVTDNFETVDELDTFLLYYHSKVYCFITFFDLTYKHEITWDYFNEEGELVDKTVMQLTGTGSPYYAYSNCDLSPTSKPGRWTVKIYADGTQLIGEKFFIVEQTPMAITLTAALENKKPTDYRTSFSKSSDTNVYTFIDWQRIKGKYKIEWEWINPDGELKDADELQIEPPGGSWWAYAPMELSDKKPGNWRVVVKLANRIIGEKEFILTE